MPLAGMRTVLWIPAPRAACAGRQFAAMLLVAHQGATVSAGRTASTWNDVSQFNTPMNSFLPE